MKRLLFIALAIIWFWWFSLASTQLNEAISRMNQKGLTKFDNATNFMATKSLRRDEASKFFVQYAKEIMWLTPDTSKNSCNFTDLSEARPDLKDIVKEACQLWLFQWSNWKFMPTQSLTNAQAITVLIRMVDSKKDETQWHFAKLYFEKAQELWIMDWLILNSTANFDKLTTRWDVGQLIYSTSKLSKTNSTESKTETKTYYTVTRVIDWDTIEISSWWKTEKIRLIWVDTPETVDTTKPIQCFWKEASKKATELLLNKKILIINDSTQNDKDIYDRLLRYVYTEKWTFINERLIKNWYAMEYTYKTAYKYQSSFKTAEEDARKNKVWLWADGVCWNSISSWEENTNTTTTQNTNNIFYTSSHYSSKLYYCDTDSARKGLSPKYLKSYSSKSDLLKDYPFKTLNEPCK